MIQANELRIGNLLYYKNTVDVAMVEIIHKKHFDCRDKYGTFTPNGRYEPIPLTEEWLEKFGFEIEDDIATYSGSQHEFDIYTENGKTWKPLYYKGGFRHIYYVHQLQNLFFSLCGEELSVK